MYTPVSHSHAGFKGSLAGQENILYVRYSHGGVRHAVLCELVSTISRRCACVCAATLLLVAVYPTTGHTGYWCSVAHTPAPGECWSHGLAQYGLVPHSS